MSASTRGVAGAITAFCLFASLPVYVQLLQPFSGYAATGQRIVWTVILFSVFLLLFGRSDLRQIGGHLRRSQSWPGYLLGSALVGVQFWAFIWGPMNGMTLDLSLGYFMLPLAMVVCGRLIYGERLRPLQWLAVMLALLGVLTSLLQSGGISWLALVVALGYPPYFILRRYQSLPAKQAFGIENLLLLPVAIWACISFGGVAHPFAYPLSDMVLFAGLGLLGAIPMLLWMGASRLLPLGLLGLLGYLEPTLVFFVGILQGEHVSADELVLYGMIVTALMVLGIDAVLTLLKRRRAGRLSS
ncbi:MAG: EamA family transporter RarD [Motiliproteus sp.]